MSKKLIPLLLMSALLLGLLATLGGCGATPAPTAAPVEPTVAPTAAPAAAETEKLILATTTSTADSGLLDFILPDFEQANNVDVEVIAVGTGQAIEIGSKGDADVLLVHSRKSEDKFVADGYAKERFDVMYNDFVIVGPESDPGFHHQDTNAQKGRTRQEVSEPIPGKFRPTPWGGQASGTAGTPGLSDGAFVTWW